MFVLQNYRLFDLFLIKCVTERNSHKMSNVRCSYVYLRQFFYFIFNVRQSYLMFEVFSGKFETIVDRSFDYTQEENIRAAQPWGNKTCNVSCDIVFKTLHIELRQRTKSFSDSFVRGTQIPRSAYKPAAIETQRFHTLGINISRASRANGNVAAEKSRFFFDSRGYFLFFFFFLFFNKILCDASFCVEKEEERLFFIDTSPINFEFINSHVMSHFAREELFFFSNEQGSLCATALS